MSINTTSHHLPATPSPLMQRHVLQRVEETLLRRFEGTVTAETVRSVVREVVADPVSYTHLTLPTNREV